MRPLDPITARCFPTLARYARRQWWLGMLGVVMILCALSFAAGVMLGSYRGQVADENYHSMVREFSYFKEDYVKRFAKELRTTKAQAQVLTARKEDGREP